MLRKIINSLCERYARGMFEYNLQQAMRLKQYVQGRKWDPNKDMFEIKRLSEKIRRYHKNLREYLAKSREYSGEDKRFRMANERDSKQKQKKSGLGPF